MLYQYCILTKMQMLPQHWLMLTNVVATMEQGCVNVVATSLLNVVDQRWDNVQATNLVATLLLSVVDQHSGNVQAMRHEHCGNVAPQHWGLTLR